MAKQTSNEFGTFGFENQPKENGWDRAAKTTYKEDINSPFGMWSPNMFDRAIEKQNDKKKIKEQENKINELLQIIKNQEIDINLKTHKLFELQEKLKKFQNEQDSTCLVTNQCSTRTTSHLLNLPQNFQISQNYNKAIVYSQRTQQYFTCVKLYDGSWIEGHLYTNPVHIFPQVELFP